MSKYVRCNLIEAEQMNLGEYNKYRGWQIPNNEDPNTLGYLVKYKDGYESWCPKDVFEQQAMQVGDNNTITRELVEYFIGNATMNVQTVDGKTTIVHCVLPNGFTMVESSSCVDPKNYDEEMGKEICVDRMRNQLWGLLGFVLQTAKEGIR